MRQDVQILQPIQIQVFCFGAEWHTMIAAAPFFVENVHLDHVRTRICDVVQRMVCLAPGDEAERARDKTTNTPAKSSETWPIELVRFFYVGARYDRTDPSGRRKE